MSNFLSQAAFCGRKCKLLLRPDGLLVRRQKDFILVLLLALSWGAVASSPLYLKLLKVGTRTYRNVTIIGANTTDLYFKCDEGLANAKLRALPLDLQKRFNYDAKAAAVEERRQFEDDVAYQNSIVSNVVAKAEKAAVAREHAAATSEDNFEDIITDYSLLGKPAPAFEVEQWLSPAPALQGKVTLIYFWAPWSIPCRKYIPVMNDWQKKYAERLVVVGVATESEEDVTAMSDPKLEFASAIDTTGKMIGTLGINNVPCVVLIDGKGNIRYVGHPDALNEKRLGAVLPKPPE